METANSLISDAFAEILVQPNEQALESVDFQNGVRYLNRMMGAWDAQGLALGYTKVVNPSDLITVADGALEGMVYNLAVRLAKQYDMPVTPDLAQNAREGLKAIRKIAVNIRPAQPPCTLPIGSGNESENFWNDEHFYPCPSDETLTEQEGAILLESNTNDTI